MKKAKKPKPELLVIGWMEHLDLPELGLHQIKAKIDTGARTSALHATQIETFTREGKDWVRFMVQPDDEMPEVAVESPIYEWRHIKNTSGIPEERIVIRTKLKLIDRAWTIAVSLTDRSNMRFPMIVGRTALKRHNIAVHTRRANLTSGLGQ
ncbi:ATP-dependent zinc protease [Thioclava sp.]|uniref:ATP-dependent zinc protease family protein n=1 Tax=Thioclava sp. TaxID=1933450 RepID=UPI003AA9DBE5